MAGETRATGRGSRVGDSGRAGVGDAAGEGPAPPSRGRPDPRRRHPPGAPPWKTDNAGVPAGGSAPRLGGASAARGAAAGGGGETSGMPPPGQDAAASGVVPGVGATGEATLGGVAGGRARPRGRGGAARRGGRPAWVGVTVPRSPTPARRGPSPGPSRPRPRPGAPPVDPASQSGREDWDALGGPAHLPRTAQRVPGGGHVPDTSDTPTRKGPSIPSSESPAEARAPQGSKIIREAERCLRWVTRRFEYIFGTTHHYCGWKALFCPIMWPHQAAVANPQ